MAKSRDPFELTLDDDHKRTLAVFLCNEIQRGLDARSVQESDCDYWWTLYEQGRTRNPRTMPWADAADLTSHLPCEMVDALHARLMRDIFKADPIWVVEGWGDAAQRAPFVEQFTQWKAEEGRVQSIADRVMLASLVEPRGLLEVYEGTERRTVRKTITAKVQTDPMTGGPVYDETGKLSPEPDGKGGFTPAQGSDLGVSVVVDSSERVRIGPVERVIPFRDSLILPAHARDKQDIWGYAKRIFKRYQTLKAQAAAKFYDADAVDRMTAIHDVETNEALQRAGTTVAPADEATAEKELWELLILIDLNEFFEQQGNDPLPNSGAKEGMRWYLTTVHLNTQQLLRVQFDDLERSRFVLFNLFPRADRATEGYSFVGHKLITTAEEHTAWRNMVADRGAMQTQSPMKRLVGALWDPLEQPWGPKAVIDVRDMNELMPVEVPDETNIGLEHIQMTERIAQRLTGVNDISAGQLAQQDRTLGELRMATVNSEIRIDLYRERFQEGMEEWAQIRHEIWRRTLAESPDGVDAPPELLNSLEWQGIASIDQYLPDKKITAALLEGPFRFKPFGSVETADPHMLRQDFVSAMQFLPAMIQAFPSLGPMLQNPQAARSMFRQFLRVFRVPGAQAFMGDPAQDLAQQGPLGMLQQLMGQMQQQGPPMGMPPQMPGPGMPPPQAGGNPPMLQLPPIGSQTIQ